MVKSSIVLGSGEKVLLSMAIRTYADGALCGIVPT
jgi:hypothetical protein